MRELTMNEVQEVSGGPAPIVVAAVAVGAVVAVAGVGFTIAFAVGYLSARKKAKT